MTQTRPIAQIVEESQIQSESGKNVKQTSQKSTKDQDSLKKAKLAANHIWPTLSDMYPPFKNKYGDTPSPTWIACLKGLNELEIKKGLEACLDKYPLKTPGASHFRALCQGRELDQYGNDVTVRPQGGAYMDFNNPAHPHYQPKRIESDESKASKRKNAKAQIANIRNKLK